jgi:DUF1680 family protein
MLKAITQYYEASGDARVIPALEKYFAFQAKHLDERPLKEWAVFRWHDEVLSVLWLYNRNGDPKLLDLARKLHHQGHDWEAQFADFRYTTRVDRTDANLSTHGVNNAMALKAAAVWWLITGDGADHRSVYDMMEALDRYHGEPNGIFSSDEHYAGHDPSQGTELCAVVEAMFSLEMDMSILGDPSFGDKLEKIAYNALPGTFTEDMWAHQYDQQSNQVMCSLSQRAWATNGPDSNIFGLEPNFGCCTANMHQGWPKLAANLWMATEDGGLAAVAYAPSEVRTQAGGVPVAIEEETGYPFRESIGLRVRPDKPAEFTLAFRIPAWAKNASINVNGQPSESVEAGTFHKIRRKWSEGDRVEIRFPMQVRVSNWYHNSIAVERGPLVYSLKIGETWRKEKQTGPTTDWEVFPATPWNYALVANPASPADAFQVREKDIPKQPFSHDASPLEIQAQVRRIPEWQLVNDSAGPLPESPVTSKQPIETVTLIPYGAAKLRITAFPYTLQ